MRIPISDSEEPSWQDYANCLGVDPDLFFPERGASTREAKEVCRGCVVREECLEYAITHSEKFGIWGGTVGAGAASDPPGAGAGRHGPAAQAPLGLSPSRPAARRSVPPPAPCLLDRPPSHRRRRSADSASDRPPGAGGSRLRPCL